MATDELSADTAGAQWPHPLRISMSARGSHVRLFRRRLSRRLGGDQLGADVVDDLVLATSEALENCCDHAFTGTGAGAVTMTLVARVSGERLTISVVDDGSWRDADPERGGRGRGLAMMRALVDEVAVVGRPTGMADSGDRRNVAVQEPVRAAV